MWKNETKIEFVNSRYCLFLCVLEMNKVNDSKPQGLFIYLCWFKPSTEEVSDLPAWENIVNFKFLPWVSLLILCKVSGIRYILETAIYALSGSYIKYFKTYWYCSVYL